MRLVTFDSNGEPRLGAWIHQDKHIVDLKQASEILNGSSTLKLNSLQEFIEAGERTWDWARKVLENPPAEAIRQTAQHRIRPPLLYPVQVRDFLCFEEHLKNAFRSGKELRIRQSADPDKTRAELDASGIFEVPKIWYQQPIYYTCSRFAAAGHEDDIHWPPYSKIMDYELEWAAVIGKKGKNISAEDAKSHIFGYTIFNDFSARDEQAIVMQGMLGPGKGKDFDNANVFGPCVVTADEFDDPYNLTMTARVNGEEWSRGNTGSMHYRFEDVIANVSRGETLHPGEILCSGTVGSGCGMEQMKFLKDGDVVELEVEGIGILRNRVLAYKG